MSVPRFACDLACASGFPSSIHSVKASLNFLSVKPLHGNPSLVNVPFAGGFPMNWLAGDMSWPKNSAVTLKSSKSLRQRMPVWPNTWCMYALGTVTMSAAPAKKSVFLKSQSEMLLARVWARSLA
jgi:hypothetical protein